MGEPLRGARAPVLILAAVVALLAAACGASQEPTLSTDAFNATRNGV